MPHFVIHSSANDHFGCFHLLTIINNADMKMGGQMSVQVPAFLCFRSIPMSGIVVIYHIFWSISKKVANIHLLDSCLFFSFTSLHHPMSFDKGLCLYLYNSNTIELWNISTTPEISLMLEGICEGTLKGLFYCSGGWWEGDQPIGKGMSPWNQADLGKCLI